MTIYWKVPISVTLVAPWVIPGDEPAGSDVDVRLARGKDNRFLLPGTHVKGHLRAAMEALVEESDDEPDRLEELFGGESPQAGADWQGANEPNRGRLNFGDLAATGVVGAENAEGFAVRVEIDPLTHAAREGHLLFVECPYQFGSEVTFAGEIIVTGSTDLAADLGPLKQAAARVFALGGMKSVGYGRVKPGSWTIGEPAPVSPAKVSGSDARMVVTYELDRPFLVNAMRSSGNLMVGDDVIPGGAIKGAMAAAWVALGYPSDELSALRIGHAHPATAAGHDKPRLPIPLSLSVAGNKLFCHLSGQAPVEAQPHVFAMGWKPALRERVLKTLGREAAQPARSGRSRTAIDRATLGSLYNADAEDAPTGETGGQLFSAVSVKPDGHVWVGEVGGDAAAVDKALGILRAGLPRLGKTGAIITCHSAATAPAVSTAGSTVNLCLLSAAAILNPAEIRNGSTLEQAYARYFGKLHFKLERFFSRETLRGGYLALRYPPESGGYSPWLLTEPGSVFRITAEKGSDLSDILENGLPPADCYCDDWQKMPFLRQNGFGAVGLNMVDHEALGCGVELAGAGQ